jgi:hypothetical protein
MLTSLPTSAIPVIVSVPALVAVTFRAETIMFLVMPSPLRLIRSPGRRSNLGIPVLE